MEDRSLSEKIDKIMRDTSYMRGQWDAIIPNLTRKVDEHEKELDEQGKLIANNQGKAAIVGAVGGTFMSVIIAWVFTKLHL